MRPKKRDNRKKVRKEKKKLNYLKDVNTMNRTKLFSILP